MFSGKKNGKTQSRIDSLIGVGTRVVGDICFSGGLRIDGEIHGNIRSTNDQDAALVISEQAKVEGNICVSRLVINGTVEGALTSSDFLELQSHARVTGDVQYNTIEIHLGAVIEGRLFHQGVIANAVELKLASNN